MQKLNLVIGSLCFVGIGLSCTSLTKTRRKSAEPVASVIPADTPKATIVTLDKIAEGYEIIIAVVDKDKADLLPMTPGEIAKKIFCGNEKAFPPENVIIVPEDDPALNSFTQQFAHSSRGVFTKAEIVDTESHVVKVTAKDNSQTVYIRVLLAKRKVPRIVKDSTY